MSAEGGSSSSLGAIIGVIVAVTLFAVGIGYLLFQRGLKKKQEKAPKVKVTHLATRHVGEEDFHLDEVDEKISKDTKEKSKSKGAKKKIDKGMKKSSAGDTGTGDTKSDPQHSEHDKEALLEVNKEDIDDAEFDMIAESAAVATRTKKRRQANTTNKLKYSLTTRKRRNNPIVRTANKLKASLTNAVPKIISMEFDESSDDESSSSSEEEEEEEEEGSSSSSSDSDSSSSSESSSQIKARKRREKRIAADKKKSTNTRGKKQTSPKPRRSNTNTKQRQRPSRPSRSNNIV